MSLHKLKVTSIAGENGKIIWRSVTWSNQYRLILASCSTIRFEQEKSFKNTIDTVHTARMRRAIKKTRYRKAVPMLWKWLGSVRFPFISISNSLVFCTMLQAAALESVLCVSEYVCMLETVRIWLKLLLHEFVWLQNFAMNKFIVTSLQSWQSALCFLIHRPSTSQTIETGGRGAATAACMNLILKSAK